MAVLRRIFMIVVIIFQITPNNPITLYPPFLSRSIIMGPQVSSAGIIPYQKVSCTILTKPLIFPCTDSSPVWPL